MSIDELEVHAGTARKLLDNPEWTPTRLLWSRLVGHLDAALRSLAQPAGEAVPVAWTTPHMLEEFAAIDALVIGTIWNRPATDNVSVPLFAQPATADTAEVERLTKERDALQAELVATREVCTLVRRQDYFDVPTPVLVEAQIEAARWTAFDDIIKTAKFQQPKIDGALHRHRTALATAAPK